MLGFYAVQAVHRVLPVLLAWRALPAPRLVQVLRGEWRLVHAPLVRILMILGIKGQQEGLRSGRAAWSTE